MNASTDARTPVQRVVAVIEKEAQKRFKEASVQRVIVDESDNEGDTLRVFVVLNDPDSVKGKEIAGFIERVRNALESQLHDDRFPLVSYFSTGDAAELFPEAR